MNILFFHDKPSGGAGESLLQIIDSVKEWHQPHVIFTNKGFLKEKYDAIEDKVPIYYHSSKGSWLLNRDFRLSILNYGRFLVSMPGRWKLIKFIIEKAKLHQIDVIYSNTIYLIEGAIAAKILGIPHIWQVRELYDLDYYKYCLPKKDITKFLGWFSKTIVCNSIRTQKTFLKLGGSEEKAQVIYNLVNPPAKKEDFRDYLDIPQNTKLVVVLGWIIPSKRVEDFIDVANHFSDENIKFLIVGAYGNRKKYDKFIKEKLTNSPNKSNIIHTGIIQNASNYLKSADILLCPCDIESFGRSVAEALVAGTPAIGIKGSATQELIEHGNSGFLIDKSDVAAMLKYTKLLLGSDKMCKTMGERGSNYIFDNFSHAILSPKYHQLFNDVLK